MFNEKSDNMSEIKELYKVFTTRQTNYGDEKYKIKVFDDINEAKKIFDNYIEDFVIGSTILRNHNNKGKVDITFLFITSPNYNLEIEPNNYIILSNEKNENWISYVHLNDDLEVESSSDIEEKVEKIKNKYRNVDIDKNGKIILK